MKFIVESIAFIMMIALLFIFENIKSSHESTLSNDKFSYVTQVDGLSLYKSKTLDLSSGQIEKVILSIKSAPKLLKSDNTIRVYLADNQSLPLIYRNVNQIMAGFAVGRSEIVITKGATDSWEVGGSYSVEHLMNHELGHLYQGWQDRLSNRLAMPITRQQIVQKNDKLLLDYAKAVGWEKRFSDTLYNYYLPGQDEGFQTTTSYAQTSILEDQAETLAFYFAGQSQSLSESRVKWVENFTNSKKQSYEKCVVPQISRSYYLLDIYDGSNISFEHYADELSKEYKDIETYVFAVKNNNNKLQEYLYEEWLVSRGFNTPNRLNSEGYWDSSRYLETECCETKVYFQYYVPDEGDANYVLFIGRNKK